MSDDPGHPARWSKSILVALSPILANEGIAHEDGPLRAVDPFAGVGLSELVKIAPPQWQWAGLELEPEWARQAPGTVAGDATRAPWPDASVDVLVTSPTYGNRFADAYDGSGDTCTDCAGTGYTDGQGPSGQGATREEAVAALVADSVERRCSRCGGRGLAPSERRSYRISLGRAASPGSSCTMKWRPGRAGKPYRQLHAAAWTEAMRYLKPDALIVVNVSNSLETVGPKHRRVRVEHHVSEWHLQAWLRLGAFLEAAVPVSTPRYAYGENHEQRTAHEWLFVLRKPPLPEPINPPNTPEGNPP